MSSSPYPVYLMNNNNNNNGEFKILGRAVEIPSGSDVWLGYPALWGQNFALLETFDNIN